MARDDYVRQGQLVDELLDFHARLMRRREEEAAELRRLTALAEWMEKRIRKNGNPDAVRDAGTPLTA